MKKIKNIITAIGNPILNNELKKNKELNIINNDIQYQEGVFELLEKKHEIDFIILSQLLPGELDVDMFINKIIQINNKIKIIIILEKYNKNLENILINKGVYRIFYNEKIEIKDIIKLINEDEKMEKYNEEIRKEIEELKELINNKKTEKNNNIINRILIKNKKRDNKKLIKKIIINLKKIKDNNKINIFNPKKNNNYKNKKNNYIKFHDLNTEYIKDKKTIINILKKNKIISVLGNCGAGKSMFSTLLAFGLKKYKNKILIIDFDILNNSLHTILGVKKYSEKIKNIINNNKFKEKININNLIININKKIDLISGINLLFDSKEKHDEDFIKKIIKNLSEIYDVIIIDTTSECFFEYTKEIIKISEKSIFLTEANLLEISKSKRLLNIYCCEWNIEKNKINILFNKYNKNCIDINLLKKIFSGYSIIGKIKIKNNYNLIINNNFKNIFLEKILIKKYEKLGRKIF